MPPKTTKKLMSKGFDAPVPQGVRPLPGSIEALHRAIGLAIHPLAPGWDPVIAMAKIAAFGSISTWDPATRTWTDERVFPGLRMKCLKEVSEYVYTKRHDVRLGNQKGETFEVTVHNDIKAQESLNRMLLEIGNEE